jgi:TolB-like protein/Flp pilus assembly protein TadD
MADAPQEDLKFEIGHVLFMDIVGYSKKLINEQSELLRELNKIVRGTAQFQAEHAKGKLVSLPTGDGMALVFRGSAEAPVQCALEISQALKDHAEIELRMGINSGPVNKFADVNKRANISGGGINMAQRVMDCGDGGHILLSKRVAEDLVQYRKWQPYLHDLGECEVKHGVLVSVVNLYTDGLGNSELPQKFKAKKHKRPFVAATGPLSPLQHLIAALAAFLVLVVLGSLFFYRLRAPTVKIAANEKSIAVLPFENLSRDPDNAYFATGIQDEILTRLAKIGALKVISRTSTQQYAAKPANLPEIARQLNVANILEGSVQRAADQVHINAQLIRAATDEHLWAESYDRKLENIFGVEAEVATAVAEALRAKLSGLEHEAVELKPTSNSDAYVLYLKAREREGGVDANMEDWIAASQLYEQAIALDPAFALAYARASIRNSRIFDVHRDQARKSKARAQAEEALRLSPTLGEVHFALGLYLWLCERDFEPALKELSIAAKASPNNAEVLWYSAAIYRNQARWRESLTTSEHALNLDPRNAQIANYAAYNHVLVRDWQASAAAFNRLLEIAPDSVIGRICLAYIEVIRNGNAASAKAILQKIPSGIHRQEDVTDAKWDLSMLERDFASAEKILERFPSDEEFPMANRTPRAFYQGCTAFARGDIEVAQRFFERVRPIFETKVRDRPDEWHHADLGLLYAYLGRKEDAIREGRAAVELAPESKEPFRRALYESKLALIYARTGEADQAITLIERLLSTPGAVDLSNPYSITLTDLRLRWEWDPLRTDPRFQKILAGPEPKTIY